MRDEPDIADVEKFGASTRYEVVRAEIGDERGWLSGAPVCSDLKMHHIAHVGRMWAKPPFKVIRADASGSFVLVGVEGQGEALIDGEWRVVKAGDICLQPAFAHTGIRATNRKVWRFAWVRYRESRAISPVLSAGSPVIHSGRADSLNYAVAGLYAEFLDAEHDASATHHWAELIHGYVTRSARPFQDDDRLWGLWDRVEENLGQPWQLAELAQISSLSPEHLRRICQRQLGRSPIQQVTYLRIRSAVNLLATTEDKVETIARAVGYQSPFTFSNAFKRWTGRRPSEYRDGGKECGSDPLQPT